MKPYRGKTNPKVIALIIEISLFLIGGIALLILDSLKVHINMIVIIIITGVLMFSLLLTLSLLRYDSFREIRSDGTFKDTNLPIYTDQTSLLGHDIKEEVREENNKK